MKATPVVSGRRYEVIFPHSEVCMHMRIAGKLGEIEVVPSGAWGHVAQCYVDNKPFSAPILLGEAGVFEGPDGLYAYCPGCRQCGSICGVPNCAICEGHELCHHCRRKAGAA